MSDKPDMTRFSHMTAEQRVKAEELVAQMRGYMGQVFRHDCRAHVRDQAVSHILTAVVREGPNITAMDKRPHEVWMPEQPEVFFPYVNQNLLEETIELLQQMRPTGEAKDAHWEVISLLEDQV